MRPWPDAPSDQAMGIYQHLTLKLLESGAVLAVSGLLVLYVMLGCLILLSFGPLKEVYQKVVIKLDLENLWIGKLSRPHGTERKALTSPNMVIIMQTQRSEGQ